MKVSVLTPTWNRPAELKLAERWLRQQTFAPHQWIVVDGSERPYGVANWIENLRAGAERATGDVLVFWEDDDYYAPTHLAKVADAMSSTAWIVGDPSTRMYHLGSRRWRVFKNREAASLCQTALRVCALPLLLRVLDEHLATGWRWIDQSLWRVVARPFRRALPMDTVVGLRWPEGHGMGRAHTTEFDEDWSLDEHGDQLRQWIGPDAEVYLHESQ